MNPRHLTAIIRIRWQMMRNLFRKSSKANQIISVILTLLAALSSLSSFVFTVAFGKFFLAKIEPFYVIYVWDILTVLFLFGWAVGLMIELQRSELLSLRNLLHLPISLTGAFFLNYTSSLANLTVMLLLPAMFGLCFASVLQFGSKSLVVFLLLTSFLLMVTAVSYQLRGWLARLMENKRTRGTVIAITTISFIMIFQIPSLINVSTAPSRSAAPRERKAAHKQRLAELEEQRDAGKIEMEEYQSSVNSEVEVYTKQKKAIRESERAAINDTAAVVNSVLPIGWLPYGASTAARGAVVLPWLCVMGMSAIGFTSLGLAYRSTFRAYTGDHNKAYRPVARKQSRAIAKGSLLEKSIPFLNDTQSVVTLATFRSMLRAPEAKMALLTPLIFACLFGSMLLTEDIGKLPEVARPWIGIGALGMSLIGMLQMMLNMFGLDRQAFRAYVLMPAPRRDILLGKNMGIFPIAGTLSALLIVFVGIVARMHFTHVIATLMQIVVVFSIYCTVSNYTSIVAPIGMATGSMKPVSMNFSVIVMQFFALLLVPVAIIPAALALAAELLAGAFGGIHGIPIYLLLTLIELPIALWFYHTMLRLQGRHLQDREQAILDVISKVAN